MKFKVVTFACCIFLSAFLTGCKSDSFKSPEKLLEKPVTNEENYITYNEIRKLTPLDTTFILPKNATEVGRINRIDLDSDGVEEVVAFKKRVNENQGLNNIYVYFFKTKDGDIIDDSEKIIRISGNNIKYANFVDMNNDNKKEMVLQVANRGFENIYIYELNSDSFEKIAEYNTSKYEIKLNFFDYNNDNIPECLALLQDQLDYEAIVSEMVIEDRKIVFKEFEHSKNVDNLSRIEIINGRVSKESKGSILVYPGLNGSIISQIIVYKDGKFEEALRKDDFKIKNPFAVKPVDINGDGIIDIPKIEFKYLNNTQKESNVLSWYTWNNKLGKESSLDLVEQIFYCYDYNFKVNIPKNLRNNFVINQKFERNKGLFHIYAKDHDDSEILLYTILVVPRNSEEIETNDSGNQNKVLYENEEYSYICTNANIKNLESFNLDLKKMKKCFSLINK